MEYAVYYCVFIQGQLCRLTHKRRYVEGSVPATPGSITKLPSKKKPPAPMNGSAAAH